MIRLPFPPSENSSSAGEPTAGLLFAALSARTECAEELGERYKRALEVIP
jgi:hypothetical protein